jgi:dihydrodipicolinate synthase/N-acetylneuraminate lyase
MSKPQAPTGLIAPALTTFRPDGSIDYGRFREQAAELLDKGMHGISPGGSTGEGAVLEDDELARLVTEAREVCGERPVVAGVIRSSTRSAVRTATAARDAGATALMVTPTFYNVLVPDEEGNTEFYRTISDEVGLPIVIYNVVPQNEISPDLFLRLLDLENVVGVKQSVGGVLAMADMRITAGDRAKVFAATDELIYTCFTLGADGAISAVLSLFPEQVRQVWDCAQEGRHEEGLAVQAKLFEIWKVVRGPQFPARMKAASQILGRDLGVCRSPSSPVPGEVHAALEKALTAFA